MAGTEAMDRKYEIAADVLRNADYAYMKPGLAAPRDEYDVEAEIIAWSIPSCMDVEGIAAALGEIMSFFFHNQANESWCSSVAAQLKEQWPDDELGDFDWRVAFEDAIERLQLREVKKIIDEQMKDLPVGSRARPEGAVAYTYHFVTRIVSAQRMMDGE